MTPVRTRLFLLVLLAGLGVLCPGVAAAQSSPFGMTVGQAEQGWINAVVTGPVGGVVDLREVVGGTERAGMSVLLASGRAEVPRLLPWSCFHRERTFIARIGRADGTVEAVTARVVTPSCRGRMTVSVAPRRARTGRSVSVVVTDRWNLGSVGTQLCTTPPGQARRCRPMSLGDAQVSSNRRVAVTRPGRWAVGVRIGGSVVARTSFTARRPGGRLTVLATGDSMIQIIDSYLKDRLPHRRSVRFHSDARVSTGLSKLGMFNWLTHAGVQARRYKPDATVVFVGANDGFAMRSSGRLENCCSDAWVAEYARRARHMMGSYLRRGAGRVYWLLLPTPRSAAFARVYRAVNRAHRLAAAGLRDGVRLVDLPRTFTPNGRYRSRMRYRGRTVTVRQNDGVHLNAKGASIAATLILRQLRRDRLIG